MDARAAVQALQPKPWPSDRAAALKRLEAMPLPQGVAALWIGDGIDEGGAAPLAAYLARQGELRYLAAAEGDMPRLLAASGSASEMAGRDVSVVVRSLPASGPQALTVRASAEDGALLARESATIAPNEASVAVRLPLPTELRNRVTRIEIESEDSAGAVLLVDERWRRRPVGIAAAPNTAGLQASIPRLTLRSLIVAFPAPPPPPLRSPLCVAPKLKLLTKNAPPPRAVEQVSRKESRG